MSQEEKIRVIAPILRGICFKGSELVNVTFSKKCQHQDKCVPVSINDYGNVEEIISKLRQAVESTNDFKCLQVEGLGCFSIEPELKGGRLSGRIALVTGAAQGVGLEIAQYMAGEGALVFLGDINKEGVEKAAQRICNQQDSPCAVGCQLDVTKPDSLNQAVTAIVTKWGGLDILIANAGVLKAESVKTQPIRDFDFVTSVNYRGYFLSVQAVSPIMALQHQANGQYSSDIIQINSKSGLEGSKRNAAYAGGKFGGIGLTQSFALELIEDGIKVNSICPGNFFDGPLWSDPKNGLFVQYLNTNKVPGAKTIEDVRKAYEEKVPMGRGCQVSDLMKAIYYLVEQKYETGQAVPVTGGQVMLK